MSRSSFGVFVACVMTAVIPLVRGCGEPRGTIVAAMPEGFHSSYDVRVRFAETDAQGIAHHASFVVWLEVARVAYLAEHAGGYRAIQEQGLEALTTGVQIDYRATAAFDDVLTIYLRCVDVRGARFRYEYRVEREGELIATAETLARNGRRENARADAGAAVVRRGDR